MKKIYCTIFVLCGVILSAQNGFTPVTFPAGVNITRISNLAFDSNGHAWLAYSNSGGGAADVLKYDGSTFTTYTTSIATSSFRNVLAIDAGNKVWVGTNNGLAVYDGISWVTYDASNSPLPNNKVVSIAFEGSNTWIGTLGGLAKFDGAAFTVYTKSNSSLPSDSVWAIKVDANNDIWIGGKNYLSHFNGTGFTSYFHTVANGNNMMRSIETFGSDHYISTSAGVQKFDGISFTSVTDPLKPQLSIPSYPAYSTVLSKINGKLGYVYGRCLNTISTNSDDHDSYYFLQFNYHFSAFPVISALQHPQVNSIYISYVPTQNTNIGFLILDPSNYDPFGQGPTSSNSKNMKFLDGNEVKAVITNRGDKFWDLNNNSIYEVPKGSGRNAAFASAFWIGGLDNGGNLHVAAQTYRQSGCDFWPGPLDTASAFIDTATASQYDKIWKIDKLMIYNFQNAFAAGSVQNGTYTVPEDILTWPAHGAGNKAKNLAPFVDVNGDGVYDPVGAGDYPKIRGDQSLYCIFNDNLTAHQETGAPPLGVEVHYEAYVFYCATIADSMKVLNYTTFHAYDVYNRSSNVYDTVYIGLWHDNDLGNWGDDLIACNPSMNYGMSFNGDPYDEDVSGAFGYGTYPPIMSTVVLDGPAAYSGDGIDNNNNGIADETGEQCLLTNFMTYNNNIGTPPPATLNPSAYDEYYNYIRSIWRDSTHLTECPGYGSGTISNYYRPYAPYDTICAGDMPRDIRMMSGIGPFQLQPGQKVSITEALVYTQDSSLTYSPNDSSMFVLNEKNIQFVQQWYANNSFPGCYMVIGENEIVPPAASFDLFPNPSSSFITLKFKDDVNKVELFDVSGKCVYEKMNRTEDSEMIIPVTHFSSGIYFVRVLGAAGQSYKKFVVSR